jgi:hypothetical protein
MINELPESEGAVLGFEVTSKVSLAEEKAWIARIEKALSEHEKISVLVILDERAGWGSDAGIADLKWIMTHMKQIQKIAIVSERPILKWLIAVDSQFAKLVGIGEKYFELSQLADAWSWIKK